jgi:capsular exopolysaccharide synthesis family protein
VYLHDYLQVGRVRWRIILLGLLIGLAGATVITWQTPRQYSAQVTIYVSAQASADTTTAAYQGNLLSQQKVKSYAQLLTSHAVARDVAERIGSGVPVSEIENEITVSTQPDTVLLTAIATDTSPQRAQQIANYVGAAFTALVRRLERPSAELPPTVTAEVVESAQLPTMPVVPRPALNYGLGLLLGLIVGCSAAAVRHRLDTSVKSVDDVLELTGAPNLGSIAYDQNVPKKPLTMHEHPHSPRAEAFRKIRTNLQFIDVDRPRKTIVVTSSIPDEGKTTTLCNLAIALAQAGRRAIVVETDLRRPRAVDYLGLEGAVGVTSVLAGRVSLDRAVQSWGSGMFGVLSSGPIPPNPSELLASQQMSNLLTELGSRYDLVLLDAPPLLPVTDAAILGAECDGALLVVRYGKTTRNQIKAAVSTLESASVRLLGTVLSMTPESDSDDYYHYYPERSEELTEINLTAPIPRVPSQADPITELIGDHPRREPGGEPGRDHGSGNGRGVLATERPPAHIWDDPPVRAGKPRPGGKA